MPDDHRNDGATQVRESSGANVSEAKGVPPSNRMQQRVTYLENAAMSPDPDASPRALAQMLAEGVPPEDIADFYIPNAARQLGDAWCRDEIGFANVTIGASRLQSLLRELGQFWISDGIANADAPTVLLAVAHDVFHTLGAMVLSGQLRRKGLSVRLMLGAKPGEVAASARRGSYDAIFLSASCGEKLESLRKIVEAVRHEVDQQTPIVIGGSILADATDVLRRTGATFATNDLNEALTLCGLTRTRRLNAATERSH